MTPAADSTPTTLTSVAMDPASAAAFSAFDSAVCRLRRTRSGPKPPSEELAADAVEHVLNHRRMRHILAVQE